MVRGRAPVWFRSERPCHFVYIHTVNIENTRLGRCKKRTPAVDVLCSLRPQRVCLACRPHYLSAMRVVLLRSAYCLSRVDTRFSTVEHMTCLQVDRSCPTTASVPCTWRWYQNGITSSLLGGRHGGHLGSHPHHCRGFKRVSLYRGIRAKRTHFVERRLVSGVIKLVPEG